MVLGTNWNGVAQANLAMHLLYRLWHWNWATLIPAKMRLMTSTEPLAPVVEEEDVAVDTTADEGVPYAHATLTTD